ncbi:MAG: tetraacyldisaccharide 4'-kinase [Bacteroidia bacterium]
MKILKLLLLPFSLFYGIAIWCRNKLYDWKILKSTRFDFPVIGIGNLSVGGTGKTPTVEYLVKLCYANKIKPAVISRGYKRNTKGYYLLDKKATAQNAGDEPYQLKRKFPELAVAVSENRVAGIQRLKKEVKDTQVVILDDSFQHRAVEPGLNILLTDYSLPFFEGFLLPAGRLREPRGSRKRADIIVVTKNPIVLSPFEERRLLDRLKPYPHQPVYFSFIKYEELQHATDPATDPPETRELSRTSVLLFTGIANPVPMKFFLERKCKEVFLMEFQDHHRFSEKDLEKILVRYKEMYNPNKILITTEKDLRRLETMKHFSLIKNHPLFYLPITYKFHEHKEVSFDERTLRFIKEF